MADYVTQFSCIFDVGAADQVPAALALRDALAIELDDTEGCRLGFEVEPDPDFGPGALWISTDDDGDPEHVIAFVLRCAGAFDLQGRWGFTWSLNCSRPRVDGFGGGAQVIDLRERRSIGWIDCAQWLAGGLDPNAEGDAAVIGLPALERG